EGFVADAKLGAFFAATDFVLLTYASSFHSQSGVLNLAVRARKPVLASASPSALLRAVEAYALGITVAPDSAAAVADGMGGLLTSPPKPQWEEYEARAAWEVNARGVLKAAGLPVQEAGRDLPVTTTQERIGSVMPAERLPMDTITGLGAFRQGLCELAT